MRRGQGEAQAPAGHGVARIAKEFKAFTKGINDGHITQVTALSCVDDQINVWRFRVSNFDDDVPVSSPRASQPTGL